MLPFLFSALFVAGLAADDAPLCAARSYSRDDMHAALTAAAPSLEVIKPQLTAASYRAIDKGNLALLDARCWVLLHQQGIPWPQITQAWHPRFDCVDLAAAYVLAARLWHRNDGEDRSKPAAFCVCYRPDHGSGLSIGERQKWINHCIVLVFTQEGPLFIDPRVGRVILSETEQASLYWPAD